MVVRMRHTRGHTANRRSHHALEAVRLSKCSNCSAMHVRHTACNNCGMYRGRKVVDVNKAIEKKAARDKKRAQAATK